MYSKWQKSRLPTKYLLFILLVALGSLFMVENYKYEEAHPSYAEQLEAVSLMGAAFASIAAYRIAMQIPGYERLDPNNTGLIGREVTAITTTLSSPDVKRTATNPDFAALLVRYFHETELPEGSVIAVGASGSFPGLILATLCAAQAYNVEPLVIYSIGSSMYGANIPAFTFLEMLKHLNEEEILPYQPIAVSLGGEFDRAEGLLFGDNEEFFAIVERSGLPFIYEETLAASIQKRLEIYEERAGGRPITCFINIGGASPNFGNTKYSLDFPGGLVLESPYNLNNPERGLMFEFIEQGVPVINLLNIKDLALKNGIPIDPVPFPEPGVSGVYHTVQYYDFLVIISLLLISLLVFKGLRAKS